MLFFIEGRSGLEAPESGPGGGKLGIVGAPGYGIGVGDHVVNGEGVKVAVGDVVGRRQDRMGVVVEGGDGLNEGAELGIDGAGGRRWSGLGEGGSGENTGKQEVEESPRVRAGEHG